MWNRLPQSVKWVLTLDDFEKNINFEGPVASVGRACCMSLTLKV